LQVVDRLVVQSPKVLKDVGGKLRANNLLVDDTVQILGFNGLKMFSFRLHARGHSQLVLNSRIVKLIDLLNSLIGLVRVARR